MPPSGHLPALGRFLRRLRLTAALAVLCGLAAVVMILKGEPANRIQALIAVALLLGASALIGMAWMAWPHRQKDKNDPRS